MSGAIFVSCYYFTQTLQIPLYQTLIVSNIEPGPLNVNVFDMTGKYVKVQIVTVDSYENLVFTCVCSDTFVWPFMIQAICFCFCCLF